MLMSVMVGFDARLSARPESHECPSGENRAVRIDGLTELRSRPAVLLHFEQPASGQVVELSGADLRAGGCPSHHRDWTGMRRTCRRAKMAAACSRSRKVGQRQEAGACQQGCPRGLVAGTEQRQTQSGRQHGRSCSQQPQAGTRPALSASVPDSRALPAAGLALDCQRLCRCLRLLRRGDLRIGSRSPLSARPPRDCHPSIQIAPEGIDRSHLVVEVTVYGHPFPLSHRCTVVTSLRRGPRSPSTSPAGRSGPREDGTGGGDGAGQSRLGIVAALNRSGNRRHSKALRAVASRAVLRRLPCAHRRRIVSARLHHGARSEGGPNAPKVKWSVIVGGGARGRQRRTWGTPGRRRRRIRRAPPLPWADWQSSRSQLRRLTRFMIRRTSREEHVDVLPADRRGLGPLRSKQCLGAWQGAPAGTPIRDTASSP